MFGFRPIVPPGYAGLHGGASQSQPQAPPPVEAPRRTARRVTRLPVRVVPRSAMTPGFHNPRWGGGDATGMDRAYTVLPNGAIRMEGPSGRVAFPEFGPNVRNRLQDAINAASGRVPGSFVDPTGQSTDTGGGNGISDLAAVLLDEQQRMQAAADEQYGRNVEQEKAFGRFVEGIGGGIMGTAGEQARMLTGAADELGTFGRTLTDQVAMMGREAVGKADKAALGMYESAGEAGRYAKMSVQTALAAVSGYDAGASANIAATVAGMEQRVATQKKMIEAGLNPDGTLMTPAQREAARRQMQQTADLGVAQVVGAMGEQMQQVLAGLRMNAAQAMTAAGQVELGAGELRERAGRLQVEARLGAAGQQIAAEGIRQQYEGMRADYLKFSAQMMNVARATAVQMEASGRAAMAEMVRNNPRSVVSIMSGLLSLYGLWSAPGGQELPGLERLTGGRLAVLPTGVKV